MAEAYGAWDEKKLFDKMHRGIIRSHFGMDEEDKFVVKVELSKGPASRQAQI